MPKGIPKGNPRGRPTIMTPEKIKELEELFSFSLTDEEACLMANITRQTLNEYCKKNEKWRERKESLKRKPTIQAKKNMAKEITGQDSHTSKWWLERKAKDEFSTRTEQDITTGGEKLTAFTDKEAEDLESIHGANNE